MYNVLMLFGKKNVLILLFILGLLIRLSIIFYDFAFDVNNHIIWAEDLWSRGFAGFYETRSSMMFGTAYPNYPPLVNFLFYLMYPVQKIVYSLFWWLNISIPAFPSKIIYLIESRTFQAAIFKLPAIFTDLATAYLIYLYGKRLVPKNSQTTLTVVSLVLLNPAFFFNSALWGQIDIIPIFFVMLSFYFGLFTKRNIASSLLFLFSILIKPTTLVFLPVYLVLYFQKYGLKKSIFALITATIFFIASFMPFYKEGNLLLFPFKTYFTNILQAQSLPFVTNGAFNFWGVITQFKGIKDTSPFIFGISYRLWGGLIVGIIIFYIYYVLSKKKDKFLIPVYSSFLLAFASFLFLTKMHERYLMLPLSFLLLTIIKDRKYLKWFLLLSLLSFINLYHSWAVPKVGIIYSAIDSPLGLSVLSAVLFSLFLFFLIDYSKLKSSGRR